ncbi:HNH endonuclease [Staphylococcus saprophyticus]|nr:HNH endonuclease [Staphylococcus saprophyticus]MDW4348948.1 HNH endonuclease [Staphylococcus saprophyticus]
MTVKKSMVNFVESLGMKIRSEIIYRHVVLGESTRTIEEIVLGKRKNGWESWNVLQVYGYDSSTKGILYGDNSKNIQKEILKEIENIDINDLHEEIRNVDLEDIKIPLSEFTKNDGKNVLKIGKLRIGQAKWRKKLLENYDNKCALCNITDTDLLVASHIKSWSNSNQKEKIDLSNGIILCVLHDKLFDKGKISISDSYNVLFTKALDFNKNGIDTDLKFSIPSESIPDKKYLKEHRKANKF